MFYISLPFFYENYQFNNFFKEYIQIDSSAKESKLIAKFNIEYSYGAFPWSIWNGGYNTHSGPAVLAKEMNEICNISFVPLRIDASNTNLQNTDYYDIHENATLRVINGTNTTYEISIIELMNYISKYNLNNKFIISNNAQILHPFNEVIINTFAEQPVIDLINIGYNLNYDLNLINNKTKLEMSIGYCGNCLQQKQLSCSLNEQTNIYNYSGESNFIKCPCENKVINYYEELLPFYKQGIQHFKIVAGMSDLNMFNINIIKSFVKPEFQGECINGYYKTIIKK